MMFDFYCKYNDKILNNKVLRAIIFQDPRSWLSYWSIGL